VGFPFPSADFSTSADDVKLLRGDNVAQRALRWGGAKAWPMERISEVAEYQLRSGDVVLAMDRPWIEAGLKIARVRDTDLPALLVQRVARLRSKQTLDQRFLYYLLSSQKFTDYILSVQTGTTVPHISAAQIRAFEFDLPPIEDQMRTAEVLESLDDLIEANESLARILDDLAAATWKVTVRTFAEEVLLGELAEVVLGGTPDRARADYWGGDIPWLNSGVANEFRVLSATDFVTDIGFASSSTKLMPSGSTLLAITGATLGKVTRLEIPACGNQSLIGVFAPDEALNDYLFYAIQRGIPNLMAKATGGAQQHVNKMDVRAMPIPVLNSTGLRKWHSIAAPLLTGVRECLVEASVLRATRDALLPLLMSGKVRAGEVSV